MKKMLAGLVIALSLSLGGCATIMTPKTQTVSVSGDRVMKYYYNGDYVAKGRSASINVNSRGKAPETIIAKDKFGNATTVTVDKVFNEYTLYNFWFGYLTLPIDIVTGAMYDVEGNTFLIEDLENFTDQNL